MPLIRPVYHLPEHVARYLWCGMIAFFLVSLNRRLKVFYRRMHLVTFQHLLLFFHFLLELPRVLRL